LHVVTTTIDKDVGKNKERAEEIGPDGDTLSKHVSQSVETIVALRVRAEEDSTGHQRAVESRTNSLGQVKVLYIIIVFVAIWVAVNLLSPSLGFESFDHPPFYWLIDVINVCALLFATMVLITQNRQGKRAELRGHLNLQVNILAEQKIAKLIELVEELRRDLPGVRDRRDAEAAAMTESADTHLVISEMEKRLDESLPPVLAKGAQK
jgi:uncharacterized membrane protein